MCTCQLWTGQKHCANISFWFIFLQANKKTRNRAYDVLVQIGHAFGDEENGGGKENLYQFFNMVMGLKYFIWSSML